MKNRFSHNEKLTFKKNIGDKYFYECDQADFELICHDIMHEFPYVWLLDIKFSSDWVGTYSFVDQEKAFSFSVKANFTQGEMIKSISHIWKNANVLEQEVYDLYGIEFSGNLRRIYFEENSGFPLAKNNTKEIIFKKYQVKNKERLFLNNPIIKNTFNLLFEAEHNLVTDCDVYRGKFHIGFEEILKQKSIKECFYLFESYLPLQSVANTFLLSNAIEEYHQVNIPDRAKAIRMILLELNRIMDHYNYLINLSFEFEIMNMHTQVVIGHKKIQAIQLSFTGNEFSNGVIRPGGVIKDTSQIWLSRVIEEINWLESSLVNIYKNILLKSNTKEMLAFPIMTKKMASDYCLSGPFARAAGLNIDLRKSTPIYFYNEIEFEVPIGVKGSAFDAVLVFIEEIFQSFKIIVQLLDNLPSGRYLNPEFSSFRSLKQNEQLNESEYMNSVKNEFDIHELYGNTFIEGPRGITGLSVERTNKINQSFRIYSPHRLLLSLFKMQSIGKEVEMILPLWTSLDISMKEVEK